MNATDHPNIKKAYHPETLVILVVEDYTLFGKEIKHALPRHDIILAQDVTEGKKLYEKYLPDMAFLDIDLPDGNGFELLDFIIAREPHAYVAMLTGSKTEEDVIASRKKGAHGYIIKPFTKSKIEQCVSDYLEYRERQINTFLSEAEKHRRNMLVLSSEMVTPSS